MGLWRIIANWGRDLWSVWDRFWFQPTAPHTLALIRILAGAMLFYTHLVWSLDLMAFLGPQSWIPAAASRTLQGEAFAWSYLWYIDSPALLWTQHILGLVVFAMLTVGLCSRVASVLACLITLSYCHRLEGALFGLDQINAMLAMYLMIGPSGAVYSIDRWLSQRRAGWSATQPASPTPTPSVSANIAIRLIQLHMCVIYLFGGISKLRGEMWWDGSAVWYAISNLEYQSWDLTWLGRYPWFIALLSHVTVFWETFYCCLIWPRLTRPVVLCMAVGVHGGIALFLGMITFGLAMIFGNLAFVPPEYVDALVRAACAKAAQPNPQPRLATVAASSRRQTRRA